MNLKSIITIIAILLPLSSQLFAVTTEFDFNEQVSERRYLSYINKIRCLVCQNESLGSSRSELAIDLRREIFQLMDQGQSDQQISAFLVARYGDFILYQPPVKNSTLMLWFGPALLLMALLVMLLIRIKRMKEEPKLLSAADQKLASNLLNSKDRKDNE